MRYQPAFSFLGLVGLAAALTGCSTTLDEKAERSRAERIAYNPAPPPKPQARPQPVKPSMTLVERRIELQGMPFGKAEMTPDNVRDLERFMVDMQPVNLGAVIVTGHTDRIGSLGYNQNLSEHRATLVRNYLAVKGYDPKLILWEGKAFQQPVPVTFHCSNKFRRKQLIDCLSPNRRVTVETIGHLLTTSAQ